MLACEGRLPRRSKRMLEFNCQFAIVLVFTCLNIANCLSIVHWLFVVVVVVLSIVKKRILSVSRGNVIRL